MLLNLYIATALARTGQFSLEIKDENGKTLNDLYCAQYQCGRILYPVLDELERHDFIKKCRPILPQLAKEIVFKAIAMQQSRQNYI